MSMGLVCVKSNVDVSRLLSSRPVVAWVGRPPWCISAWLIVSLPYETARMPKPWAGCGVGCHLHCFDLLCSASEGVARFAQVLMLQTALN